MPYVCELNDHLDKGCPREGAHCRGCPYFTEKRNYRITGITKMSDDEIHAQLEDVESGNVIIAATLDYILNAIEERGYDVDNYRAKVK